MYQNLHIDVSICAESISTVKSLISLIFKADAPILDPLNRVGLAKPAAGDDELVARSWPHFKFLLKNVIS